MICPQGRQGRSSPFPSSICPGDCFVKPAIDPPTLPSCTFPAAMALLCSLSVSIPAAAQSSPSVSVDLGVLETLGPSNTTTGYAPSPAPKRQRYQRSRLHVPPPHDEQPPPGLPQIMKSGPKPGARATAKAVKPSTQQATERSAHPVATTSRTEPQQEILSPKPVAVPPAKHGNKSLSQPAIKVARPEQDPLAFAPAALSLAFEPNEITLPEATRSHLDTLARDMRKRNKISARLMAYASGDPQNPSRARRTSLARALAIRSYLLEKGIPSNRIGLCALGRQAPDGRADRVDILLAGP